MTLKQACKLRPHLVLAQCSWKRQIRPVFGVSGVDGSASRAETLAVPHGLEVGGVPQGHASRAHAHVRALQPTMDT